MLIGKGSLLLNFFCHIVAVVAANNATIDDKTAINEIFSPISYPKTMQVPLNPSVIPIHCLQLTSSFKIGPAKIFVNIGCKETIKAPIVADSPRENAKKTPPK